MTNTHTHTSPNLNGRMAGCRHKKGIPTEALDGSSSEKDCTCEKVVMVAEAGDGGRWGVCV